MGQNTKTGNVMRAFHNDPAVKEKYVARVRSHIERDNLVRGYGWSGEKGCAVGCTLQAYSHARYPIELGIPEWLARVEDAFFEGMSVEKSRSWPLDFLLAIPVGADLDAIKPRFMVMVLESTLSTFDHQKYPNVLEAIQGSMKLWESPAAEADAAEADAAAAVRMAWAAQAWAAQAARTALVAAARSLVAWEDAVAAATAVRTARAADAAAWAARMAAARSLVAWEDAVASATAVRAARAADAAGGYVARMDYFADWLLEMLKRAPVAD